MRDAIRRACRALALAGFLLVPAQSSGVRTQDTRRANAAAEEQPTDVSKIVVAATKTVETEGRKCLFHKLSPISPLEVDGARSFAAVLKKSDLADFLTLVLKSSSNDYRLIEINRFDRNLLKGSGFYFIRQLFNKDAPRTCDFVFRMSYPVINKDYAFTMVRYSVRFQHGATSFPVILRRTYSGWRVAHILEGTVVG